jgi:hypothetical protein
LFIFKMVMAQGMTEIDFQRDFLILQLHILHHNPFRDGVGQVAIKPR